MAAPAPKPSPSGKPGGLPIWAWAAAAGVGLLIGFVFLRQGSAAAAEGEPGSRGPGSPASDDSGGGVVALPPELLAALGLRAGLSTDAPATADGGGEAAAVAAAAAPAAGDAGGGAQWDAYAAGGQTNAQLPVALQVPGLAPDAPVISSYFNQQITVRGPGNTPTISTVKPPSEVVLPKAQPGGNKVFAV